ncbi:MAG: hypothetical protein OXI66_11265 [Boseongicola sp.]|nr:hypothetical protein [Boseongicola sp.]MXW85039.1 hypothetical protein [Boseongicola sp. SB0667_bin_21]MYI69356.1 hypothetical protein [Boseongicola sp. SB0673_bin_14]
MSSGNATETARSDCAVRHTIRDIRPSLQGFDHFGARGDAGCRREVRATAENPAIDRSPIEPGPPSRKRAVTGKETHGVAERRGLRPTDLEGPATAAAGARMCELRVHLASGAARVPRIARRRGVAHEPGAFEGRRRAIERNWDGGIER